MVLACLLISISVSGSAVELEWPARTWVARTNLLVAPTKPSMLSSKCSYYLDVWDEWAVLTNLFRAIRWEVGLWN